MEKVNRADKNVLSFFVKKFHTFVFVFVLANAALFVFSNSRPINYLHDEISTYRFFWSMDSVERLTLHTGFTWEDFKKPFASRFTVGAFRPRQVSNFAEMVFFKFSQLVNREYFRDYSLIFLHIFNVFLFWFLIYKLSGSFSISWIAAIFVLNAGASLTTLLIPFRIAKILVITFFLLGFNLIVSSPHRFDKARTSILILFFFILLCGVFTDETFVFLCLIYLAYLWIYQGRDVLLSKRLWLYLCLWGGVVLGMGMWFYFYSKQFDAGNDWHQSYTAHFVKYFSNFSTIKDIFRSLLFFLKRNFGYWELSLVGIFSFLAFGGITGLIARTKRDFKDNVFLSLIVLLIIIKALFLPHIKVHPYIMPADTVFPSMMYFSYYYVYIESFLVIFILTFGIFAYRENIKILLLLMIAVTWINFNNTINAPRGLADTLKFHGLDAPPRKQIVENIKELQRIFSGPYEKPMYLSLFVGDSALVDGRFGFEKTWPVYTAYLLTMFLPQLEKNDAIISLENIKLKNKFNHLPELVRAESFYDVMTRQYVDLKSLKNSYGDESLMPKIIEGGDWTSLPVLSIDDIKGDYIFFVKGFAEIRLQFNERIVDLKQGYGESYQLFSYSLQKDTADFKLNVQMRIRPILPYNKVDVVGPFFIPKTN